MPENSTRKGFTLVELLVVIAIIGVLVALLLPAVQAAREAARRTSCTNNLRQMALALHNYATTHGELPAGGLCPHNSFGRCRDIARCHTWFELILPQLEQQSLYDQIDFDVAVHIRPNSTLLTELVVPGVHCPSDPEASLIDHEILNTCGSCDYGTGPPGTRSMGASYSPSGGPVDMNGCTIPAWPDGGNCQGHSGGAFEGDGAPGMFVGGSESYGLEDCEDGTSNTFLIGETIPHWDPFKLYLNSHLNVASCNPPPNWFKTNPLGCENPPTCYTEGTNGRACIPHRGGFNSLHPGGLNMAMTDGSVHFIDDVVDYDVWVYLGDRRDGNIANFGNLD
ncbi:DUF1559 domain-containing protein [Pirellulales bacterium]|nr:DUF1559 domain-containing protein [Pirellulales bacterium]